MVASMKQKACVPSVQKHHRRRLPHHVVLMTTRESDKLNKGESDVAGSLSPCLTVCRFPCPSPLPFSFSFAPPFLCVSSVYSRSSGNTLLGTRLCCVFSRAHLNLAVMP